MDWLEQELRKALAREDPPEGFERRVQKRTARRAFSARSWLAAAASVVIAMGAGVGYREYRGHVAKEQVKLAMRIAALHANHIQTQLRGIMR